jgi:hypothetical protein
MANGWDVASLRAHYTETIAIALPNYPIPPSTTGMSMTICLPNHAISVYEVGRLGRRRRYSAISIPPGHTRPVWPSPFSRRVAILYTGSRFC